MIGTLFYWSHTAPKTKQGLANQFARNRAILIELYATICDTCSHEDNEFCVCSFICTLLSEATPTGKVKAASKVSIKA